jgi:thiaminase
MNHVRLHESLFNANAQLVRECAEAPFVQRLANGSLPESAFRDYLGQDALFLRDFIGAVAVAIKSCAERPEVVAALADLIVGGMVELESVEHDAVSAGVDLNLLDRIPSTKEFAVFLQQHAQSKAVEDCLAVFTPCLQLYSYLGRTMIHNNKVVTTNEKYKNWFEKYASVEMQRLTATWEGYLDSFGKDTANVQRIYHDALLNERNFFLAFAT